MQDYSWGDWCVLLRDSAFWLWWRPILVQEAVLIAELMFCFRLWEILATTRYLLRVGKGAEGQIDYIVLTSMNLMSSISKRFADLTSLYALDLSCNFLTGTTFSMSSPGWNWLGVCIFLTITYMGEVLISRHLFQILKGIQSFGEIIIHSLGYFLVVLGLWLLVFWLE